MTNYRVVRQLCKALVRAQCSLGNCPLVEVGEWAVFVNDLVDAIDLMLELGEPVEAT